MRPSLATNVGDETQYTSPYDEDEEGSLLATNSGNEVEDDPNLADEGEEQADSPNSFFPADLTSENNNSQVQAPNSDMSLDSDSDYDDSVSQRTLTSEPEDSHDARNHKPASIREAVALQEALSATIDDLRRLTGEDPDRNDLYENYFSQWALLQNQLSAVLEVHGRANERTILFGLGKWTGGIFNWRTARPAIDDGTWESEGLGV